MVSYEYGDNQPQLVRYFVTELQCHMSMVIFSLNWSDILLIQDDNVQFYGQPGFPGHIFYAQFLASLDFLGLFFMYNFMASLDFLGLFFMYNFIASLDFLGVFLMFNLWPA